MYVQKSEEIYKDALISFAAIMVDIWRTINFSTKYMNLKSQNDSPKNFDWKNFMLISKKFQEHEHNWGLSKKQIQTFINLSTAWKTRKVVFWKMLTDRFSTRTTFQLTFFLFRNIIKLFLFSLRSRKICAMPLPLQSFFICTIETKTKSNIKTYAAIHIKL